MKWSSKCVVPRCEGHLGRHDNCLSEALWNLGEDYADEHGGDSSAHGYHMLFLFDSNTWISDLSTSALEYAGTPDFQVAQGTCVILTEVESGHVYLEGFDSPTEARGAFDDMIAQYGRWSEVNEY